MALVCATHFSPQAQEAADAAAELASRHGMRLWLVHVLNLEAEHAANPALRRPFQALLDEEARRLSRVGADVGTALLSGPQAEAILDFALSREARLLLVGAARKETPFGGLGGSLDRLVQASSLPLLVVKDAEPLRAWARGKRPLKVMLGVDRTGPFAEARDWVARLRELGPLDVVAGHVFWPGDEYARLGLLPPPHALEVTDELKGLLERDIGALFDHSASPLPVKVRVQAGMGRVAEQLVALASQEAVDLLVVGTHQHKALGKLWSVTHHSTRIAPMSVACIPPLAQSPVEIPLPSLQRVLVATDFSERGNRAVPYAFALVQPGGHVELLHVSTEAPLSDAQRAETQRKLAALVPTEALRLGKHFKLEVQSGEDPALVIIQAAERGDADLICLGSHRRSTVSRAVLGSVASQVMGQSRRPVLVIKP